MKYSGRNVTDHDFYCTRCGRKGIPICRQGRMREIGHLKYLYCLNCKSVTNHAECIPGSKYTREVFLREYKSGNFDKEGNRIASLSEWRARQGSIIYEMV